MPPQPTRCLVNAPGPLPHRTGQRASVRRRIQLLHGQPLYSRRRLVLRPQSLHGAPTRCSRCLCVLRRTPKQPQRLAPTAAPRVAPLPDSRNVLFRRVIWPRPLRGPCPATEPRRHELLALDMVQQGEPVPSRGAHRCLQGRSVPVAAQGPRPHDARNQPPRLRDAELSLRALCQPSLGFGRRRLLQLALALHARSSRLHIALG
mmetsp:Transcript_13699/g.52180  ORF Transcript_13699/g.52180 Transcript_13699/m.52180 type:complete len:204 (+) Transcript_13699:2591-3202(+)